MVVRGLEFWWIAVGEREREGSREGDRKGESEGGGEDENIAAQEPRGGSSEEVLWEPNLE